MNTDTCGGGMSADRPHKMYLRSETSEQKLEQTVLKTSGRRSFSSVLTDLNEET